jgi:hypothetical protein
MIERILKTKLEEMTGFYPVVTLLGPRQSGKTTLARSVFPSFSYANLENPEIRSMATDDPKTFFEEFPEPILVDEVQRVPSLLSHIQVRVDANRAKTGRFILTGSHEPLLKEAVSQSLAGRTAELELLPLSMEEIADRTASLKTDDILLRGFFPGAWTAGLSPVDFHRNYFRTYVERDVRTILEVRSSSSFEKFLRLLSGRIGQVLNLSGLAGEIGVSVPTVEQWLSVTEASFITFRLHPWSANIGKRFIKSPKVYFTDVGLAAYLLGIETPQQLARDPLRGHLFENMVVSDLVKSRTNAGRDPNVFFVRDSKGFEIDALCTFGRNLFPMEIKSARTFNPSLAKNLQTFSTVVPDAAKPTLVYDGDSYRDRGGVRCINFRELSGSALFG